MSDFTHMTEAIRAEAGKWRDLSDRMSPIQRAVDGLQIEATAFYIGDVNAGIYADAYFAFQVLLSDVLTQAVTEFDQIGGALDRIAGAYEDAEKQVSLDLDEIFRELPPEGGA